MFKDKYNLTLQQNIFLAKKLIVENIYNSAKLEGCNVTFPDTKTILDGISVANLKMGDVEIILNL
ncbi:MAG: death-on-curing protein, partial [Clostridiales bacterium]|nr:death-on-curing protein [Clostridiales bacterium]